MRVPRIYWPEPLAVGVSVALTGSAANHLTRVLRLKPGAALILFNGQGGAFAAELTSADKRTAWAQVTAALPAEAESPLRTTLAQAISRGDRMDYTLQKAVELGVSAIQPLITERGGRDLNAERLARKLQHWRGVVISAAEQCGRNRLPEVCMPLRLADWLQCPPVPPEPGWRLLLDPAAALGLRDLSPPQTGVTVLIGAEGGLEPAEIAQARAAGFVGVRLGPRILRTETASLAVLAALQTLWGDWA